MRKNVTSEGFIQLASIVEDYKIEGINKSDCDFISTPVFFIKRRDKNNNLICDCGKGLTVKNAFLSAFYEMIERVSAERFLGQSNLSKSSARDSHLKEKYKNIPTEKICYGENILDRSILMIPQDVVKFPPESEIEFNGTIGLASGVSYEDAVIHAIYEVLEHDSISLFLKTGLPCYQIEIDDSYKEIFEIKKAAEAKGIKCTVRLLTSPFDIFPVLITYENMPGFENYKVAGIGCSLDPVIATRRALTECEQSAALWHEKYMEKDMEESEIYHPSFDIDFLYSYDFKTIKLSDIPAIKTENELEYLKKELSTQVREIIVVDISRVELQTNCVKVIIPDLEFNLGEGKEFNNIKRIKEINKIMNQFVSRSE